VVRVLWNHAQINLRAQDRWRSTALHEAAKRGHLAVIKLLLARPNTDINIEDGNWVTPLWWATRRHHNRVAERLLEEPNPAVNAVSQFETPDPDRSTSLHHAVQGRSMPIIGKLLAVRTLDPNVTDHLKRTPLGWAASEGDVEMVRLLLSRPDVLVNAGEPDEQPPLWLAAARGHIQVVRLLLQRPDIDINRGWGAYLPPLLAAIINGHSNVAMQLLAFGQRLDVDTQTYQKESALSLAARQGDLRVVDSILLDCRTDRNSVDDRKTCPPEKIRQYWRKASVLSKNWKIAMSLPNVPTDLNSRTSMHCKTSTGAPDRMPQEGIKEDTLGRKRAQLQRFIKFYSGLRPTTRNCDGHPPQTRFMDSFQTAHAEAQTAMDTTERSSSSNRITMETEMKPHTTASSASEQQPAKSTKKGHIFVCSLMSTSCLRGCTKGYIRRPPPAIHRSSSRWPEWGRSLHYAAWMWNGVYGEMARFIVQDFMWWRDVSSIYSWDDHP
jgi:ankyrin repeat protein